MGNVLFYTTSLAYDQPSVVARRGRGPPPGDADGGSRRGPVLAAPHLAHRRGAGGDPAAAREVLPGHRLLLRREQLPGGATPSWDLLPLSQKRDAAQAKGDPTLERGMGSGQPAAFSIQQLFSSPEPPATPTDCFNYHPPA